MIVLQSPRFIPILFYRAIYLWYHSHVSSILFDCCIVIHPYCLYNWLRVCLALSSSSQQYHRSPRTLIWHSTLHFDVMDRHYEGLVDWECAPPFLRDASSIPIGGVYEKGGAQSLNWRPHVHCCGVLYDTMQIYIVWRGGRRMVPLKLIQRP